MISRTNPMYRVGKSVLAFALVTLLTVTQLPVPAFAAEMQSQGGGVTIKQVEWGESHHAVVTSDGALWVWGDNEYGQVGDGTAEDKVKPVKVLEGVESVKTYFGQTVALKADGSLWMWGNNAYSDGTCAEQHRPVKTLDNVSDFEIGQNASWAIKTDKSLWVWSGTPGTGSLLDSKTTTVPVKIFDDVVAAAVPGGGDICLAKRSDDSLWVLGKPRYGYFSGVASPSGDPVQILENVREFGFGGNDAAYAILHDGSLWVWGKNDYGQLGVGNTSTQWHPVKILDNVIKASVGNSCTSSAAITEDGGLWVWGSNTSSYKTLGIDTDDPQYTPVRMLEGAKDVFLSWASAGALMQDGRLLYWGGSSPSPVTRLTNASSYNFRTHLHIFPGAAIADDGGLWTWGKNDYAHVGNGKLNWLGLGEAVNDPVHVLSNVVDYWSSSGVAALTSDGSLWVWGTDARTECDGRTDLYRPTKIFENGQWLYGSEDATGGSGKPVGSVTLSDVEYLSDAEARCYLGFLFGTDNLTDEQLAYNDFYKLMTGRLTGTDEVNAANAFLTFEDRQLSGWAAKITGKVNDSSAILVEYLSSQTSGDFASDVANEIVTGVLQDVAKNSMEAVEMITEEEWKLIKEIKGAAGKVEKYRSKVDAVIASGYYLYGTNNLEMYNYYLAYRNSLYAGEYSDLLMDAYRYSDEKVFACEMFSKWLSGTPIDAYFNNWATEDREALLEMFATWSFNLEQKLKAAVAEAKASEPSEDEPLDVPTFRIEVVNPTCTTDGAIKHVCDSDPSLSYAEAIPAYGHEWDEGAVTTGPTCESAGVRTFTCKHDASHAYTETIPALGHDWDGGSVTTEPTCETEGVRAYACRHDASHAYAEPIAALGHDWGEWAVSKPATEDEEGARERVCEHDSSHRETEAIPRLAHVHALTHVPAVAATCDEAGSRAHYACSGCGKWFEDAEGSIEITDKESVWIAPHGHKWGEWVVATEPTAEVAGERQRTCALCGAVEKEEIPKLQSPEPEDTTGGVGEAAEVEDEPTGVIAKGAVLAGREGVGDSIVLVVSDLSKSDAERALELLAEYAEASAAGYRFFDVRLESVDSSGSVTQLAEGFGELVLSFPVGDSFNGRSAKIVQLHRNDNGEIETILHDAVVSSGMASITVDRLSEFVVSIAGSDSDASDGGNGDAPEGSSGEGSQQGAEPDRGAEPEQGTEAGAGKATDEADAEVPGGAQASGENVEAGTVQVASPSDREPAGSAGGPGTVRRSSGEDGAVPPTGDPAAAAILVASSVALIASLVALRSRRNARRGQWPS